jgi:adenine-specific DNA-methyltransferase
MQMVSSCINPAGSSRDKQFMRSDEYIFFVGIGAASPTPLELSDEWLNGIKNTTKGGVHWNSLMRTGTSARRQDRPNMFYPIYINPETKQIVKVGEGLPLGCSRFEIEAVDNTIAVFPIRTDGSEGRWRVGAESLRKLYENHFVKIGRITEKGAALSYLAEGEQKKINDGTYEIMGIADDNSYIINDESYTARFIPMTQWMISFHDASRNGTNLLMKVIGEKRFSFPKSLYAVHDSIRFFVANKPNALILDFFAGSGTTLHAVNLLNAEDGGNRRCIMVTNNEVSDAEAKEFQKKGLRPGDQEWESKGIARYVTWPRTVCSIKGENINGEALKGEYLGGDKDKPRKMSEGFKANAAFFKLGFLNPGAVALGRKFKELLPVLWMKAGAHGECPKYSPSDNERGYVVWPQNKMGVLFDEGSFAKFSKEVRDIPQVETIFVVTDYEPSYRAVVEAFPKHKVYSLYGDYLTSFRVNVKRG